MLGYKGKKGYWVPTKEVTSPSCGWIIIVLFTVVKENKNQRLRILICLHRETVNSLKACY